MLRFVKYQGAGNDFLVVDRRGGGLPLGPEQVMALCERHRGVGADGVLSIWPDPDGVRMQVQNSDGSESEMCGNGIRCVARYLDDTSSERLPQIVVRAGGRLCVVRRAGAGRYSVDMGRADADSSMLPAAATLRKPFQLFDGDAQLTVMAVSFGNPHLVIFTEGAIGELARRHGASLERHPAFPARANVSFTRQVGADTFEVIVYERGAGFPQACGSAACAVAATAVWSGRAARDARLSVRLPGGVLVATVDAADRVELEGDATRVFAGEVPA